MYVCGKRLSFIREKVIAKQSQLHLGVSGRDLVAFQGVNLQNSSFFIAFTMIKRLTMAFKKTISMIQEAIPVYR